MPGIYTELSKAKKGTTKAKVKVRPRGRQRPSKAQNVVKTTSMPTHAQKVSKHSLEKVVKKADHSPIAQKTSPQAQQRDRQPNMGVRTDGRSTVRDTERIRRVKARYAFEFFQDQIFKLKELRRNALIKDEQFSMSDIVRKALDEYLTKIIKYHDRTTVRSTVQAYGRTIF